MEQQAIYTMSLYRFFYLVRAKVNLSLKWGKNQTSWSLCTENNYLVVKINTHHFGSCPNHGGLLYHFSLRSKTKCSICKMIKWISQVNIYHSILMELPFIRGCHSKLMWGAVTEVSQMKSWMTQYSFFRSMDVVEMGIEHWEQIDVILSYIFVPITPVSQSVAN